MKWVGWAIGVAAVAGIGYLGWREYRRQEEEYTTWNREMDEAVARMCEDLDRMIKECAANLNFKDGLNIEEIMDTTPPPEVEALYRRTLGDEYYEELFCKNSRATT